ncbi:MAG: spore cortex biosynthesis protein YabQ [Lachnospiraceae bacterium]|nr:spore cortex biosynthesis protein YabQ [Lachnospiraceae bacterium]
MILSLSYQAKLFITTVVWGFILAFFYDAIKVLRIAVKHKKLLVHIEDALYWVTVIFVVFFVLLGVSFGEIRVFCVAGVFLGMALYFSAVSPLFLMVSEMVVNAVKWVIRMFLEILFTPFRLLWHIFKVPCKKTGNFVTKNSKKALHLSGMYAKIYTKKWVKNLGILLKKI